MTEPMTDAELAEIRFMRARWHRFGAPVSLLLEQPELTDIVLNAPLAVDRLLAEIERLKAENQQFEDALSDANYDLQRLPRKQVIDHD